MLARRGEPEFALQCDDRPDIGLGRSGGIQLPIVAQRFFPRSCLANGLGEKG